ncbi:MAG: hypothetical protein LLF94_10620 [Chlamydiales bacterium]|nr:hypothetical protein [Chlamydiales bacterium]
MRISLIFSGAIFLATSLAADSIPLQQMMTQQEKNDMGLDSLNAQQRQAFETWAAKWTHHVLDQAPSYRPGQNITQWIQSWPSYANPTKTQYSPEEIAQRQESNQLIDRVRNDGEFIDLKDGSSWHISPFYRRLTTTWQKNQTVEVKKGRNQMHPWILQNISSNEIAEADLLQDPSATGQKPNEPPEHYNGAVPMSTVTTQGDLMTLGDGTVWKIAPTDMYKAKNWSSSDRIRVEPSDNFLYKYRLTNLDTGEVTLANPKK